MIKQGRWIIIFASCFLLEGCLGAVWTGATLVYDRHNIYKKMNDYQLSAAANQAFFSDNVFKSAKSSMDIAVFNGDVLVAGHVPTLELRTEAQHRLEGLREYRRIFNQLSITALPINSLEDSWITAKIRTQILADGSIDPKAFKIVTVDGIVYIMGDVKKSQAKKVIAFARFTSGVSRVVTVLKYYTFINPAVA